MDYKEFHKQFSSKGGKASWAKLTPEERKKRSEKAWKAKVAKSKNK